MGSINGEITLLPADLMDPRQVKLFDALDQLRKLEAAGDIDIPQLIVVGNQNSGKSSVLEALVGFEFPVDNNACTRFPTHFSLRRGDVSTTASIKSGSKRNEYEKSYLEKLSQSIRNPNNFHDLMKTVNAELGKKVDTGKAIDTGKGFCDDVLLIERRGPDLPQLSLVDLPGLFEARSREQTDEDQKTVHDTVATYVRNKGSVVMVIASAQEDIHNSSGIGLVQTLAKEDESLDGRTIYVITKPDKAESFTSIKNAVDKFRFPRPAHFLRNQDSESGRTRRLVDRDMEEETFFSSGEWVGVPQAQKGISALRTVLKEMLWAHTKEQLQRLIPMVEEKTEEVHQSHSRLVESGRPDRHKFLIGVAQKFEQLMRDAVIGNYVDPDFFSDFDDTNLEIRYKKLLSTTRALNKKFAITVQEYGKTVVIGEPKPSDPAGAPSPFLHDEIDRLYNYAKPESKYWDDYETWVAERIEDWRGGEPRGQASSMAYWALFEYQSKGWKEMAKNHLKAVWMVIDNFINLALAEACPDDGVARTLRKKIMDPQVKKLRLSANTTLQSLLSCHSRGNSGFYDSLADPHASRSQAQALITKIAELPSLEGAPHDASPPASKTEEPRTETQKDKQRVTRECAAQDASPRGSKADESKGENQKAGKQRAMRERQEARESREKWIGFFLEEVSSSLLGTPGLAQGLVKEAAIPRIASVLAGLFESKGDNDSVDNAGPKREMEQVIMNLYKSDIKDLVAAHLIEQVEEHYEHIRTSFVGYVCSLVVEHTILKQLQRSILTSNIINDLDKETIEAIAKEKPGIMEKRKSMEKTKQTLEGVLKVLKDYNGQ